jgi:hypothetical protein
LQANLEELSLQRCSITDEGIAKLCASCTNLSFLKIAMNLLVTSNSLKHLGALRNLKCLDIFGCHYMSKEKVASFARLHPNVQTITHHR